MDLHRLACLVTWGRRSRARSLLRQRREELDAGCADSSLFWRGCHYGAGQRLAPHQLPQRGGAHAEPPPQPRVRTIRQRWRYLGKNKGALFEPFQYISDHSTKTGSGQTCERWREKRWLLCRSQAEVWYANDPGRTTGMIDGPSDQGIDRSEKTGAV